MIDLDAFIVNHIKTTIVCTFVCTRCCKLRAGGYPQGAGELLSACSCCCIWGDTLEVVLEEAGIRYRLRPVA